MSESFIKIVRKLIEWEWYNDSKMVHLFIHLLLKANFKNNNWRGVDVKRGQLVTGLNKLHEQTHISKQSIRTCLKKLQSTNEITLNSTSQYSVITLVNYEKYQTFKDEINTQTNKPLTNDQHATNKPSTTREERKQVKKERMKSYSVPEKGGTVSEPVLDEVKDKSEKKEKQPAKEKKERTDLHHRVIAIYSKFMIDMNGIKPQITGQDGEAAKRIIDYLRTIVKDGTDEGVCAALQFIFKNWQKLEKFQRDQIKLIQIAGNMNPIITQFRKKNLSTNDKQPITEISIEALIASAQKHGSAGIC